MKMQSRSIRRVEVGKWVWAFFDLGWVEEYPDWVQSVVGEARRSRGRWYLYLPSVIPDHWRDLTRGGVFPGQWKGTHWELSPEPQRRVICYLQRWAHQCKQRGLECTVVGVDPSWRKGDRSPSEPPKWDIIDGRLIQWWDTTCPREWLGDLVCELDNFYPPLLLMGTSGTSGEAFLQRIRSKIQVLSADILVVGVYDGESYLVYRSHVGSERM